MKKLFPAVLLCLPFAFNVQADETGTATDGDKRRVELVGSLGLTTGGDELASLEFVDGDDADIKAGGLFSIAGGLGYQLPTSPLYLQSTIGYHFDSVNAENADASFSRVPFELLAFYTADQFRVGGGLSYHLSPELEFELDGVGKESIKFDDAAGLVLQADYLATRKVGFGLRAVFIEYDTGQNGSEAVDGNQFGLQATIFL
ncbi:MAG: hypothetical protein CME36_12320 [unclassified Hahellaceae]|nr:hypothetical protein [Hahellaceae bacterium]|tara:strand:- start:108252 stop:108857 length:606 start_codon:yes stop_codon:yes gene_type:complete